MIKIAGFKIWTLTMSAVEMDYLGFAFMAFNFCSAFIFPS
jgi:hypothetical protein